MAKRVLSLKARKDAFVREYLVDFNARQACIRIGVPPKGAAVTGGRMLSDAYIKQQLEKHQARLALKYDITHGKILRDIIDIGERAELAGQYGVAIKAKELVGRHVGMWPREQNPDPPPPQAAMIVLKPEEMTQEQRDVVRRAIAQAKAKEIEVTREH